jgi:hypothetical protein
MPKNNGVVIIFRLDASTLLLLQTELDSSSHCGQVSAPDAHHNHAELFTPGYSQFHPGG